MIVSSERWRGGVMALLFGCLAVACRSRTTDVLEPVPLGACVVGDDLVRVDSVLIAVDSVIAVPQTLVPRSDDERLIFRQLYETLVTVDCDGRVRPGLADTWTSDTEYYEWRFTLRRDARFNDGSRVMPLDVLDAWERVLTLVSADLPVGQYLNFERALTDDQIVIRLEEPDPDFPMILSRPEMAVARYGLPGDRAWPVGTAPYTPAPTAGIIDQVVLIDVRGRYPSLVFKPAPTADRRDALDASMHVVSGRTRAFIDYLGQRSDYVGVALPWDRIYGVVVFDPNARPGVALPQLSSLAGLRSDLAGDVVSVRAQPLQCPGPDITSPPFQARGSGDGSTPLFFSRDSQTAGEIAARLVAMSNGRENRDGAFPIWAAEGVEPSELLSRMLDASSAAVFSIATHSGSGCQPARVADLSLPEHAFFVPLIQTRRQLAMRAGQVSAVLHGDGLPQFFATFRR